MFNWKKKQTPEDIQAEILNAGFDMAMAFGKSWQVPINSRLAKQYPKLSEQYLAAYDQICRDALANAYQLSKELSLMADGDFEQSGFAEAFRKSYGWINDQNLQRLYTQCRYYLERESEKG